MSKISVFVVLLVLLQFSCVSVLGKEKNKQKAPKNIILLIGDGMGTAQVYAAITTSKKPLNLERFSVCGFSKTYSAGNYITDSGAGGTAISSGQKTKNKSIGVDSLGKSMITILEYAERNGLATGLVSTSSITHATPASFIAHVEHRKNEEDIALDFLATDVDVFIGGGLKFFTHRKDKLNLLDSLRARNYQVLDSTMDYTQIKSGKLAALTALDHNPGMRECRGDMLSKSISTALNILSKNKKGFFIMTEGSMIDWGGHDNDLNYVIDELIDFDKAIGVALDFAAKDGNTLVIVTADHETGGLTLLGGDISKGEVTGKFTTDGHTAVMVPVFAFGPGAEKFGGIYQNTAIFDKMMEAYGFKK